MKQFYGILITNLGGRCLSKFELSIELPCQRDQLFDLVINYKNYKNIFPKQIKEIEIIQDSEDFKVTKEWLIFKSIIKKEIIQESEHRIKKPEFIKTKIISGPLKNSVVRLDFQKSTDNGTLITVNAELKTNFKFKILSPVIKKYYKSITKAMFYKMNGMIINS